MGPIYSYKSSEEQSRWKSTKSGKKTSRFGDSSIDNYRFLELLTGGMEPKRPKFTNETVILDEVDEAVKERIFQSDAALQSSSSNHSVKPLSVCKFSDLSNIYNGESVNDSTSSKAATYRKDSHCTQRLPFVDNEPISIISDEDNDYSSVMVANDLVDDEGSSGDRIHGHESTSHEMESVVVHPEYVKYGRKHYLKTKLTFLCGSIKLDVSEEEEPMGFLTLEWKTLDLISIESRWLDPFNIVDICLYIKPEHPELPTSGQKSGILEVNFTVCDPCWALTQRDIKNLDERYKEKWDVDLDSCDSFEDDVTCVEGSYGSITISKSDFQLLQPMKFINDTIVDFYIEYLKKKMKPPGDRFHFFNCFFFRKLADFNENQLRASDTKEAFQRVRKWTKKVNIFQKDYIFIPVNFRLHWSLIVICHPGEAVNFEDEELATSLKVPCIMHMDSIKGSHRGLENIIRCYLWEEWKERSGDAAEGIYTKFMNLRFLRLEVPQQQNSYDCGLFMLHYIELFVKQAPLNFNPVRSFISQDWFYPMEASLKRTHIRRLIFELAESRQLSSPGCSDEGSSEVRAVNEEEAEVKFLHETHNAEETCCGSDSDTCVNICTDVTPIIMAKPLRSEPYLCSEIPCVNDEHMDIDLSNEDTSGPVILASSSLELQPLLEESPEAGDDERSLIVGNEQHHGQLVLYDPSNTVSSPIEGSGETEDVLGKQLALTGPPPTDAETKKIDSFVMCIDRSLNFLQLKENDTTSERVSGRSSSSSGDNVLEVKDSDDECCSSSSDDVFETCVVVDSDSDEVGEYAACYRKKLASCDQKAASSVQKDCSKRRQPVASQARKRLRRRNSSDDLQVISLCE